MASFIHDKSPLLRHSWQQSHNKGLYNGSEMPHFLIWSLCLKCLVHCEVYCTSWSRLLSFLYNSYTHSNFCNFSFTSFFIIYSLLLAVTIIECNNKLLDLYVNLIKRSVEAVMHAITILYDIIHVYMFS